MQVPSKKPRVNINPIVAMEANTAYLNGVPKKEIEERFGHNVTAFRYHWKRMGLVTSREAAQKGENK